ncbi:hypothetical protein O6H91_04G033900 [Diphasiastrum complanatum]|uniref:Uncharacterized protein n=1 Tax=Diphasiastrum complanatum TaxID=34168 RepID=A0ACC2DWF4_DIPCM|nr:hypothetical protein O6H91_04G033900 [Diphasiastrum complanatum]
MILWALEAGKCIGAIVTGKFSYYLIIFSEVSLFVLYSNKVSSVAYFLSLICSEVSLFVLYFSEVRSALCSSSYFSRKQHVYDLRLTRYLEPLLSFYDISSNPL